MRWNLIGGDDSLILDAKHHSALLGVRPSLIHAPDSVGRVLCSLLGKKTEAPTLTGRGLSVLASLMCERWNHLLEWLGEVAILCADDS